MGNKLTFQHYFVAFLDLVGQREALRRLLSIPATAEEEKEFIETVRQSLGKVLELRRDFAGFFDGATRHDLDLHPYPTECHETIRAAMQTEYTISGMSDAIVIAVPLSGDDECCKDMNSVRMAMLSIGGLAIAAFAVGMMFRGGLDVGIATRLDETNEVYGSALVKAYHLESEVAEYPRFVVGDGLLDFIETVRQQVPNTVLGRLAQHDASSCRRMIVQDTDGRQMLDFLGTEVKDSLGASVSADFVPRGYNFTHGEYEKFLASGQEKLASRYFRLTQYYLARKKAWGCK